jgi:glycosyltransferase involved in cell wall biosynthesis
LHRVKSLDTLIRAFSIVLKSFPKLRLVICGKGEEKEKLEKLSRDLGISKNITFAGFVPDPERYMAESLALVLPSIYEPLGMVFIEMMAYGRPVIATRVGGIPEIVKGGETGLLVSPENPEELARAIMMLVSDSQLRRKMGRRCKLWAKRFYPEVVAEKYLQVYEEVKKVYCARKNIYYATY